MPSCRIAVILACHNRREKTIACLRALDIAQHVAQQSCDVYLVDDGSTDGTTEAVAHEFPHVRLLRGDGTLFWNRSMHWAFGEALRAGYDFYLWLNDDTLLESDALTRLLACHAAIIADGHRSGIVIGSTRDEVSGKLTYGGLVATRWWKPLAFRHLPPSADRSLKCDTMNGNVVLIPDIVARGIGNIEPAFAHAMGDMDYGLRAKKAGFSNWIMPGFAGRCARNPTAGTYLDPAVPLRQRIKKMVAPKGLPPKSWLTFTRRHAGPFWLVFWVWPYTKLLVPRLRARHDSP